MRELYFKDKITYSDKDILFTDFRFPRKDKDWQVEELIKIVYKPQRKIHEVKRIARIIRIDKKDLHKQYNYFVAGYGRSSENTPDVITPEEAYDQGFSNRGYGNVEKMKAHYNKMPYDYRVRNGYHGYNDSWLINKLTLYWVKINTEVL